MPTSPSSGSHPWSCGLSLIRRTAVCGPACTVVWQGRRGDPSPYADCADFSKITKGAQPMIVNMSEAASEQEINHIIERVREAGYQPHVTRGTTRTIVAAVGSGRRHEIEALRVAPGVEDVVPIAQPFKLVSRQVKPHRSIVRVGEAGIGGAAGVVL